MNEYSKIARVYFLGIGGIGMSALARYFLNKNVIVSGYDKTSSALTQELEKEGAQIHYTDNIELLDKNADLIIYTPAIPQDHKEMNWYKKENYTLLKRSDVLNTLTQSTFNICIAGTHGKTTTSTMVAHILRHSGYGCNAFLGGISVNYKTNFWSDSNNVVVVEADEYDRSFLKLSPNIALISSMDADHLDIYGTKENMQEAFAEFASKVKEYGLLLTKFGLPDKNLNASTHWRYSLSNESADSYAVNIVMKKGGYEFDVIGPDWLIENLRLNIGGMHNVENVVGAITIARYLEIDNDKIRNAVAEFKGVKRRFEYIISPEEAVKLKNNVVYVDDYAHHPEELKALISSTKALFNNRKCTIIFQPHLYSRTRDFASEFAGVLDLADEIILLPIYPARELPIEGITSKSIIALMKNKNASVLSKELTLEYLQTTYLETVRKSVNGQILLTAGAGNIDQLIEPIKQILESYRF